VTGPARRAVLAALAAVAAVGGCRSAPPALPPLPPGAGTLLAPPGTPAPAPADPNVVDRVVAVVNEEPILMSELLEAVILYLRETREAVPTGSKLVELQHKVLARLVDQRLQIQEARREKVEVTDEEVREVIEDFVRRNGGDRTRIDEQLRGAGMTWDQVRREMRNSLLVQKIRSRRVARRTTVTEAEVDAYLAENRAKLESELKYRPRHIAVLAQPPDSPAAWERAKAEIEAVAARLRAGEDFAELARQHSKDASADAGGDLGWLRPGEIQPLFEAAILAVDKGGVTAPIKSEAGYHLFRLEDREALTDQAVAQLRQQARDLLAQRKAQERFEEWVQGLRQRALIAERL
jgi:peptidyl-prolyl cis-trans isomerase SurA